jgi:hypothetical protein
MGTQTLNKNSYAEKLQFVVTAMFEKSDGSNL